ncbi:MAG: tRNA-dihydrouridine synthase family protein [Anaerolineales bacterium]|nr:tRNA-dihydrouridine synthase family protein [Anaerolineales bacterium]
MDAIVLHKGGREILFRSDLVLAPLDGYGDQPFRSVCQGFGSGANYIPFIGAEELLATSPRLHKRIIFSQKEHPVILQLVGNHEERLLRAALRAQELGVDAVDLNLGCSAKGVSSRGAGAGLLQTPEKIASIASRLYSELQIPLTAKIRLGWDEKLLNYLTVAQTLADSGVQMLAVHGRTRKQAYRGLVNWDAIAEIKQQVHIPIIGNGDVVHVSDIKRLFDHTGCDAVMIGRAAIDNPWIFQRKERADVSAQEFSDTIHHHLDLMCAFYGEMRGLTLFRKYLTRYLAPYSVPRSQILPLLTCIERSTFNTLFADIPLAYSAIPC